MAFCASGVIIPFERLPSGRRSLPSPAPRLPWARATAAPLPRIRNCRRVHMSLFSFAMPLGGDGGIILFQQVVVLRHEFLARVLIHFLAQRFGQMAPNVFVQVRDLVHPVRLAFRPPAALVRHLVPGLVLLPCHLPPGDLLLHLFALLPLVALVWRTGGIARLLLLLLA